MCAPLPRAQSQQTNHAAKGNGMGNGMALDGTDYAVRSSGLCSNVAHPSLVRARASLNKADTAFALSLCHHRARSIRRRKKK